MNDDIDDSWLFEFDMSNNEKYKKLLLLKEQYLLVKQQLEELDTINNPKAKTAPSTRDLTSGFHRPTLYKVKQREPMDPTQLQTCLKQIIERHGGGCNINTITAYIQQRWPGVTDEDGNAYTAYEYKKVVKDLLNSKDTIFQKSGDLWTLCPSEIDVDNISEVEPLSEFICKVITENDGSCGLPVILKVVKQKWIPPVIKEVEISKEEITEFVSTTIETNPKFQYDPKNPNNYSLAGRPSSANLSTTTPVNNAKKRNFDVMECDSSPEEIMSAPPSPEEGYVCMCGATTPGKTQIAKWRFDPTTGTYKCISCFGKHRKYNSKDVFAKKKKEVDREQWIQCDRCHKWVSASSDNISDLTLYDDTNPDHLDYFCPKCRVLNKEENKRPKRKGRTSRNSLKAN